MLEIVQMFAAGADDPWAQVALDTLTKIYYLIQPGWSDPIMGPTPEEEALRRKTFRQALAAANGIGLALADPEIHPEQEMPDGTVRWRLMPAGGEYGLSVQHQE